MGCMSDMQWAVRALDDLIRRSMSELAPRPDMSYIEWVEKYRVLSKEESNDFPGPFSLENTPALRGILSALGRKGTRRVIAQKSAQIGYTAGIVCTVIG